MENSGFNTVDLLVFATLLVSGVLAFMRGFVREIFSLGAWVGASMFSVFMYPTAKPWVHHHIKNEMAADAATALGLFCLGLVVLIPIGHLLAGMVKGRALTAIDRSLGFVFGLTRGVLVVCLLFMITLLIWPKTEDMPDWLAEAKTRPLLSAGAEIVKDLVPKDKREKMADEIRKQHDAGVEAKDAAQQLIRLSTPKPVEKEKTDPAYGNDDRNEMNDLVDQKAKTKGAP